MFMTYEEGVVVVDAPPAYASHISTAIAEVTDKPITHLVYSHYHADHIGGGRRSSVAGHAKRRHAEATSRRNSPRTGVGEFVQYCSKMASPRGASP